MIDFGFSLQMQSNNAAQAPRVFVSALPAALAQNLHLALSVQRICRGSFLLEAR